MRPLYVVPTISPGAHPALRYKHIAAQHMYHVPAGQQWLLEHYPVCAVENERL
ncbi:hypothetical protein [Chitinophaga rhizophila]|uniref:Uncharacterized protein n=1 Tax=Chitinophaga rhizophila TaxID=2866212 RepID=A0ABS7G786_9BACT|nr:hypothetical protein [Chitinophaga rhizophila]MBW8683160.1 hypothetical protein [Chitinophaga rhizophila]